jgi:Smg protein
MTPQLDRLLAELRERFPGDFDPAEVERFLRAQGVDRQAIGELVARLAQERDDRAGSARGPEVLFRVEGPHERGRFAPEAWAHLLAAVTMGTVGYAEFEGLVDRLLTQIEGRIGLTEVRTLLDGADPRDDGGGPFEPTTLH